MARQQAANSDSSDAEQYSIGTKKVGVSWSRMGFELLPEETTVEYEPLIETSCLIEAESEDASYDDFTGSKFMDISTIL